MIETRALPQTLWPYTASDDPDGTTPFVFGAAIPIKGDLQADSKRTMIMMAQFGFDASMANVKVDFIPIRYTASIIANYCIQVGSLFYEIMQIGWQGAKHWELLLKPWTAAVPV